MPASGTSRPVGVENGEHEPARGRERWVVNKLRALCAWYTKGIEGGAALRVGINTAGSVGHVLELIDQYFGPPPAAAPEGSAAGMPVGAGR